MLNILKRTARKSNVLAKSNKSFISVLRDLKTKNFTHGSNLPFYEQYDKQILYGTTAFLKGDEKNFNPKHQYNPIEIGVNGRSRTVLLNNQNVLP